MRATYHRTEGVRHLFAAYKQGEDKLIGHVEPRKTGTRFLELRRYLRSLPARGTDRLRLRQLQPAPDHHQGRPHRSPGRRSVTSGSLTRPRTRPSRPHRGRVQGAALPRASRHHHPSHKQQASMIRRYIIWRNNHAYDEQLRRIVNRQT
jgi:hypothetical protein